MPIARTVTITQVETHFFVSNVQHTREHSAKFTIDSFFFLLYFFNIVSLFNHLFCYYVLGQLFFLCFKLIARGLYY